MKKLLLLLLSIVAFSVNGATPPEVVIGGVKYAIDFDTKTATVAQAFRDRVSLTILRSVEYDGVSYPVKNIPNEKLADFNVLEEIAIEADLDFIGISAFEGCLNLKKVTISGHVDSIKNSCFRNCSKLSEVILTDVNVIGDNSFELNDGYQKADEMTMAFPPTLKSIGEKAFCNSAITDAIIPESVEWIGDYAFSECSKLKKLIVNCSMPTLSSGAFSRCTSLSSVEFNGDITEFTVGCFSGCSSLKDIKFPRNIQKLGNSTFNGCAKLSVNLPETITSVGDYALAYTPMGIDNLPKNITEISRGLFRGCGFTSVVVPERIKVIYPQAFFECTDLERVEIAGKVPFIGESTFSGCKSLKSVKIHGITADFDGSLDSQTTLAINKYAFKDCEQLQSIAVPYGITAISSNAFNNCQALTYINLPETLETIATDAFAGCSSLKIVSLPPMVTTIKSSAFPNLAALETVNCYATIPPKVDAAAFNGSYPQYMTLHVPTGYKDVYTATNWKMFGNILDDLDPDGYVNNESIVYENLLKRNIDYTKPYDVFNTVGIHMGNDIQNLSPGLYVIQQDRNAEKLIVR